jgi:hypothetical protein
MYPNIADTMFSFVTLDISELTVPGRLPVPAVPGLLSVDCDDLAVPGVFGGDIRDRDISCATTSIAFCYKFESEQPLYCSVFQSSSLSHCPAREETAKQV